MRELTKLAFAVLVLCAGLSPSHGSLSTTVAVTPSHAREHSHAHPAGHLAGQHARPVAHPGATTP